MSPAHDVLPIWQQTLGSLVDGGWHAFLHALPMWPFFLVSEAYCLFRLIKVFVSWAEKKCAF